MFKNLLIYRLAGDWSPSLEEIESGLSKMRFTSCGPTQPASCGWVPPRGIEHAALVESIDGHLLLTMKTEEKILPASVVKRRTEELAKKAEEASGRKPGRKQMKELKEQAELELLPNAFTKEAATRVWIDRKGGVLGVDATSAQRAEEVITALVKSFDGFAVGAFHTEMSPSAAMAHWLASGEPPAAFTVDRECALKSCDEMKSVVRYARHPLDIDEVRGHIAAGKAVTALALTWDGRVSFVLSDTLKIGKLDFLDVVFEGAKVEAAEEAFDADAAIFTGELSRLVPDLLAALGGVKPETQAPGTASEAEEAGASEAEEAGASEAVAA